MEATEVLEIIEKAARDGRTELNLSNKDIESLPPDIGQLHNVATLNLSDNQLTSLPMEIRFLDNLATLNLSGNRLTSLPAEMGYITSLTTLYLWGNKLTSLPADIGYMENLTSIYLDGNQLTSLPAEIGKLINLTELDLTGNQLTSLPAEIGNLQKLTELYLSENQLETLPPEIANLKNLTELYLSGNQLKSLPAEIANLENLKVLDISGNQFVDITSLMELRQLTKLVLNRNRIYELPREILDLGMSIRWSEAAGEDGIFLAGNPLEIPPINVIKKGAEEIQKYFKKLDLQKRTLNEAKVLLVGDASAGKTSLAKHLTESAKPIDPNVPHTEGINTKEWLMETENKENLRVILWDFGGLEIYHAVHRFFFSKSSLYLFIWSGQTADNMSSFNYWLNTIKLLGDNSPVILVLNRIDERTKAIDEQFLQDKFNNIVSFEDVSTLDGTGIEELTAKIKEQAAKLPLVRDILSKRGIDIQRRLETLQKNYISYDEFVTICKESGLDEHGAKELCRCFHDWSVVLHFADNEVLEKTIFLKPDWAIHAIYMVMDSKEVRENNGKFEFEKLTQIWKDYPEEILTKLLELMKEFEFCFKVPETQTYIVPELLEPERPDFKWDDRDNLHIEYRYRFMPTCIIARLIVKMNNLLKDDCYWKNGAVLQYKNTEALLVSDELEHKISVRLVGSKTKKLLAIIRKELENIHKTLNGPDVSEMLPCNCSGCSENEHVYFHSYSDLIKAAEMDKDEIECKNSFEAVSINQLLDIYARQEDLRRLEQQRRVAVKVEKAKKPKRSKITALRRLWYERVQFTVLVLVLLLTLLSIGISIYLLTRHAKTNSIKTEQLQQDNKTYQLTPTDTSNTNPTP